MKIDKTNAPLPATQIGDITQRTAKANGGNTATGTNASTDSVHLGSASAQLHSLEKSIASSPVVDSKKVAAIKQAITEGRFQINSGVVADGIIESAKELIKASSREVA
jgi:negative regulator of flagellin synthesis FlgM